jgi:hypothetical protein
MEGGFTLLENDTEQCTNPWCGMDLRVSGPDEALSRARIDQIFFWHYFLLRCPHPGQRAFIENANATINALACSNRYGKTTILAGRHFHKNIFKVGAEHLYLDPGEDGYEFNVRNFLRTRYRTVHTAGEWDQAAEVWEDAQKLIAESPRLAMLITSDKKSMPPHINFLGGARWLFRTLGIKGSGIDGKNFYLLSIDEGGWIMDLEEMMRNVLQIRIADVRGQIDVVGTFKPGMSKDFFKICVRASAATGVGISFDHRSQSEGTEVDEDQAASLDEAIFKYAADVGFDLTGEIIRAKELGVID